MKLIIGLGNPGTKYELTRHNTGFRALDILAGQSAWKISKKFQSELAEAVMAKTKIILAKPQTFMNKSGTTVAALARFYKIKPADVLIIYDDIDLLVGQLRWRPAGSAGGHNGMASVITSLGTNAVARLRIGIAERTAGKQLIPAEDYVLRPFTKIGEDKIKKSLARVPEIVAEFVSRKLLAVSEL